MSSSNNLRTLSFVPPLLLLSFAISADTTTFEYDALGRLEKVTRDDGTEIDIQYDAAGNRLERTVDEDPGSGGGGPPNNPPTATNDSTTIPSLYQTRYPNVLLNDSDPDGDPLVITSVTQPYNATVTIGSGGVLNVTATNYGTGTSAYTISDGNGGTDTATLFINVTNGGGPPL